MAEFSGLWTTGGAGDGASTYTRADWAKFAKVFAACHGFEGVAPNWLNALAGTVTGANTVSINTGGALVDGKPYDNSAPVSVNIPSAVGGGNTRIDRIVLRANWTAQTVRITRIAGTDAGSPTAPAITQTPGTTYDIMLYQALVNTAGAVTLTDERIFGQIATAGVADLTITGAKIADLTITGAKIAANAITDTKIFDSNVTTSKIIDLGVTEAKLAANSVSSSKIGNGVPVLDIHIGDGLDAVNWNQYGTTTWPTTGVKTYCGMHRIAAGFSSTNVSFPVAFSGAPLVFVQNNLTFTPTRVVSSANFFTIYRNNDSVDEYYYWFAIGPE